MQGCFIKYDTNLVCPNSDYACHYCNEFLFMLNSLIKAHNLPRNLLNNPTELKHTFDVASTLTWCNTKVSRHYMIFV